MPRVRLWLPALILALMWSQAASAHFLWLVTETAGQPAKAKVFFAEAAEPDDPDLLDKVVKAEAWTLAGRRGEPRPLTLTKGADALEAELPAEWQQSAVFLRHTYGAMTRGNESFLLMYYAKTYPSALSGTWKAVKDAERLPLEIVPKPDGAGTLLQVTWKGEYATGASVTITGPGIDKKLEGNVDERGVFRCELPAAGVYSIRAKFVEAKEGELDGTAYQSVRHYSTLSLPYAPTRLSPSAHALPALPEGITSFGGAIAGDALYVYGGNYGSAHQYSMDDQSGDMWKLDLKNPGKWEQLGEGPKLQGLAMVEHRGRLYRVGGFTAMNKEGAEQDLRSQPDFARYNPESKTWEQLPALPEPRSSHDAALIGDTLYVAGGWNLQGASRGSKWHDTALAVNLAVEPLEWKPVAAPPFQRRALALAAWEGKLYCVGGMQGKGGTTTAVAVFDPTQNTWSEGPALIGTGMDGFGSSAFACQGSLYVTTMSGSIQRLAGEGTHWEYLGQLAHPRFFHRLLPWNDKLVVVGGGSMQAAGKILELEVLPVAEIKTAAK